MIRPLICNNLTIAAFADPISFLLARHFFRMNQAWEAAIRSFSSSSRDTTNSSTDTTNGIAPDIAGYLKQLSATDSLVASIPRKWKLFYRYIVRNQTRILSRNKDDEVFGGAITGEHSTTIDNGQEALQIIARNMHAIIQAKQKLLMNLPETTRDEDSAYGQLDMLLRNDPASGGKTKSEDDKANADVEHQASIYVVHRLDCETSGVMVFARNQAAAAALCQAWRERDQVSKTYMALVEDWPPLYGSNKESVTKGRVELLLAPSDERLKWKVARANDTNTKSKPSITEWRILDKRHKSSTGGDGDRQSVILELKPITGRTHQLRIVCAHLGSGIVGDSLYGKNKLERLGVGGRRLLLHAHKLSFVHPDSKNQTSGNICEFISWPEWYQNVETS